MYVYRDIEARSCNHRCSGKTIRIAYSECVSVALCIQHATSIGHVVNCGVSGYTTFFHIITDGNDFLKKCKGTEPNLCVLVFVTFSEIIFFYSKNNLCRIL
jgi:hypothetical protein